MRVLSRFLLILGLAWAGPVMITGCDKNDAKVDKKEVTVQTDAKVNKKEVTVETENGAVGRALDKAGEATDKALDKAGKATDKALDRAGDATQRGLEKAGDAVDKADKKVEVDVRTEH